MRSSSCSRLLVAAPATGLETRYVVRVENVATAREYADADEREEILRDVGAMRATASPAGPLVAGKPIALGVLVIRFLEREDLGSPRGPSQPALLLLAGMRRRRFGAARTGSPEDSAATGSAARGAKGPSAA